MLFAIVTGLALCAGCVSETVTRQKGVGQGGTEVVSERTVWIWQKDFWTRR